MQDLTARLLNGRTVLLITHDPAEVARLGQNIMIMTRDGLHPVETPMGSIPRAVDDPGVLGIQAALLQQLRTDR